jgi:hypothetical protein
MLAKGLAEAYVAYLPWLGFAIGLVFLIISISTSPGLRSRRLRLMGLGVTAVSLVVLLGQQFL